MKIKIDCDMLQGDLLKMPALYTAKEIKLRNVNESVIIITVRR